MNDLPATTTHDELLGRLASLLTRLRAQYRSTGPDVLRLTALSLASLGDDDPERTIERLDELVRGLKKAGRWTEPLGTSLRFALAAMLLRHGLEPEVTAEAVRETLERFKQHGLKRGTSYTYLAAFHLVLFHKGAAPPDEVLERMRQILDCWKQDHRWLTGVDDYPMAAVHAVRRLDPGDLSARVEATYQALRRARFGQGDQLQLASHLLAMGEPSGEDAAARFTAIAQALRAIGISVGRSRYDEVALLTLVPGDPNQLAAEALRLSDALRAIKTGLLSGGITKELALSMATGLILSGQAVGASLDDAADISTLALAQAALQAQQAAVAAAMISMSAAAGAAATS